MLDEDGHVKLVDFGLSKENVHVPCDEPLSPCGSILYMAPEVRRKLLHPPPCSLRDTPVNSWIPGCLVD